MSIFYTRRLVNWMIWNGDAFLGHKILYSDEEPKDEGNILGLWLSEACRKWGPILSEVNKSQFL